MYKVLEVVLGWKGGDHEEQIYQIKIEVKTADFTFAVFFLSEISNNNLRGCYRAEWS